MPYKDPEKRRQFQREYRKKWRAKNPDYHRKWYHRRKEDVKKGVTRKRGPKGSDLIAGNLVYAIFEKGINGKIPVKIGVTENLRNRRQVLQTGNSRPLGVLGWKDMSSKEEALELENDFHSFLESFQIHGEWFLLDSDAICWVKAVLGS
jgi:hypothetical protein